MTTRKIPEPLRRDLLLETGYRCAMPGCRETDIDIEHIDDWAKVGTHEFSNLIAICPNCHRRVTQGKTPKKALKTLKANLSVINRRYSDAERRALQQIADNPGLTHYFSEVGSAILLERLIHDGYLEPASKPGMHGVILNDGSRAEVPFGPVAYRVTEACHAFVERWLTQRHLEE